MTERGYALPADHRVITEGRCCPLCRDPFKGGEQVALLQLPDPAQSPDALPIVLVHAECVGAIEHELTTQLAIPAPGTDQLNNPPFPVVGDIERIKAPFTSACPDCGSTLFHPGPRGGMAHNIMCAGCGSMFWFSPPFTPERINSEKRYFNLTVRQTVGEILNPAVAKKMFPREAVLALMLIVGTIALVVWVLEFLFPGREYLEFRALASALAGIVIAGYAGRMVRKPKPLSKRRR